MVSASTSTQKRGLSDVHKRSLQVFVEIPPSPLHRSTMSWPTPTNKQQSKPTTSSTPSFNSDASQTKSLKRKLEVFVEIPPSPLHRTTPKSSPHSASINSLKRRLQVFVEIPPSPLHSARSNHGRSGRGVGIKGNPLSSKALNSNTKAGSPLKKLKLDEKLMNSGKESVAAEKFPNGSFYCHQCRSKVDNLMGLHCTLMTTKRCAVKYCKRCIKVRYGQDAEEIRRQGVPEPNSKHVTDEVYLWACPKCEERCNCHKCRKAKGLQPLGRFKAQSQVLGINRLQNTHTLGKTDDSIAQVPITAGPEKPKARAPRPKKAVREPRWTAVPTELNRMQVEDRLFLREFILRFAPLMKISTMHLEGLDVFDSMGDACAKTLIVNLLDLIAADAELEEQKMIKNALKKISSARTSPGMIWGSLDVLRKALPPTVLPIPIPDPAPAPLASAESEPEPQPQPQRTNSRIRSRAASNSDSSSLDIEDSGVMHPVQLLPVLLALCECALQGASAREEIENGCTDTRGENRAFWAKARKENEQWLAKRAELGHGEEKEKEGGSGEENKKSNSKMGEKVKGKEPAYTSAYKAHKETLSALEHVHALELQGSAPRFAPLGRDAQGRVYYAASAHRRVGKKDKVPAEEDRAGLRKWGWFLAVWGQGSVGVNNAESEDRWWGFADPVEIKQLVKWITATEKLDGKDVEAEADGVQASSISARTGAYAMDVDAESGRVQDSDLLAADRRASRAELKTLVKNLSEYANLLTWRIAGGAEL